MSETTTQALNELLIVENLERVRNLASYHRLDEAQELLEETLRQLDRPDIPEPGGVLSRPVLALLVELDIHAGMLDEAEQHLERLSKVDPTRSGVEALWLSYYRGHLTDGLEQLAAFGPHLPRLEGRTRVRAFFAAGKLLSDAGRLDEARGWLLEAIRHARQAATQDLLAPLFGALAEVFYLGGDIRTALELAELDSALLPTGSVHVERLMVYRAHCYRQLDQVSAARSLYEEAYQAARLRGFGEAYPLRGAVWCSVLEAARSNTDAGFAREIEGNLQKLRGLGEPYSLCLALMAVSWLEGSRGDEKTSLEYRRKAASCLQEAGFGAVAAWCRGEAVEERDSPELPSANPTDAPLPACDRWLGEATLEDLSARRASARQAFERHDKAAAREWMGVFF